MNLAPKLGAFGQYGLASAVACGAVLTYAATEKTQFYPIVCYLSTNKINLAVMGNFALFVLLACFSMLRKLFLGRLHADEVDECIHNFKMTIMETCLSLTSFTDELTWQLLGQFVILLCFKVLHWLAAIRADRVSRQESVSNAQSLRLQSLMFVLGCVDVVASGTVISRLIHMRKPNVQLLVAFEYTLLLVAIVTVWIKFIIVSIDRRRRRVQSRGWAAKNVIVFYVEMISDLTRFFLLLVYFIVLCSFYSPPLYQIRNVGATFYSLVDRIKRFVKFSTLTANMNERFPDATESELLPPLEEGEEVELDEDGVDTRRKKCIICWDYMHTAKKLPCNHMFHFDCLRDWLQQQQNCPHCRSDIPLHPVAPQAAAGRAPSPPQVHAHAPAAAAAAAAPAVPQPRPAHAQRAPLFPMQREQELNQVLLERLLSEQKQRQQQQLDSSSSRSIFAASREREPMSPEMQRELAFLRSWNAQRHSAVPPQPVFLQQMRGSSSPPPPSLLDTSLATPLLSSGAPGSASVSLADFLGLAQHQSAILKQQLDLVATQQRQLHVLYEKQVAYQHKIVAMLAQREEQEEEQADE